MISAAWDCVEKPSECVNYDDWLWDLGIPENPAPFDIHINCIN